MKNLGMVTGKRNENRETSNAAWIGCRLARIFPLDMVSVASIFKHERMRREIDSCSFSQII